MIYYKLPRCGVDGATLMYYSIGTGFYIVATQPTSPQANG